MLLDIEIISTMCVLAINVINAMKTKRKKATHGTRITARNCYKQSWRHWNGSWCDRIMITVWRSARKMMNTERTGRTKFALAWSVLELSWRIGIAPGRLRREPIDKARFIGSGRQMQNALKVRRSPMLMMHYNH